MLRSRGKEGWKGTGGTERIILAEVDPRAYRFPQFLFPSVPTLCVLLLLLALFLSGCALTMQDQPRYEGQEASSFFADGAVVRPPVPGTVARGQLRLDDHLYRGGTGNTLAETFPFTVTLQTLERGQDRYDIFCAPCHGLVGDGAGIVTEYGLEPPTSFHDPDLRAEPVGYYFRLITDGNRRMPSYAARINPEDRWAIIAYVRALQLSQAVDAARLSADDLQQLNAGATDSR